MKSILQLTFVVSAGLLLSAGTIQAASKEKAEKTIVKKLKKAPGGLRILDGAITAQCVLSNFDTSAGVYRSVRIDATNNVDHLISCRFSCDINRKSGGTPYAMKCTMSIPGRTSSSCGADQNYQDYISIAGGGYDCS